MTLKSYLWGIKIATILSFGAWSLVIWLIDPEKAGVIGQFIFFTSTALFLSSVFVFFFTWMKSKAQKSEDAQLSHLSVGFRQGILMAILVCVLLILQQYRILTWWDGALTVAGILLVELYFLTKK
ncbi:MAG: hypothetical protein ACD_8C00151G0004 [uncultured bacterium]|nr:MAG: hypothetical protein ACD_8C00151G0004 [uncultured bacterium]